MDSITYRTTDPTRWGAGQNARLSKTQGDINIWVLYSMIQAVQDHASTDTIASIDVSADQMFVTMADGTVFGPFTLPTAQWIFRPDGWQPTTLYSVDDVFSTNGSLYLVLFRHVSAATFDPSANDGAGHDYYQLLLGPGPYDVGMFFPDRLPDDGSILLMHVAARPFTLPAGLTGVVTSAAILAKAASDEVSLPIYKNATLIGAILFGGSAADVQSDGSEVGTFVFLNAVQFAHGDRLIVYAPAESSEGPDATAQGLAVTLGGILGAVAP
jgi:hypothetical protein